MRFVFKPSSRISGAGPNDTITTGPHWGVDNTRSGLKKCTSYITQIPAFGILRINPLQLINQRCICLPSIIMLRLDLRVLILTSGFDSENLRGHFFSNVLYIYIYIYYIYIYYIYIRICLKWSDMQPHTGTELWKRRPLQSSEDERS